MDSVNQIKNCDMSFQRSVLVFIASVVLFVLCCTVFWKLTCSYETSSFPTFDRLRVTLKDDEQLVRAWTDQINKTHSVQLYGNTFRQIPMDNLFIALGKGNKTIKYRLSQLEYKNLSHQDDVFSVTLTWRP